MWTLRNRISFPFIFFYSSWLFPYKKLFYLIISLLTRLLLFIWIFMRWLISLIPILKLKLIPLVIFQLYGKLMKLFYTKRVPLFFLFLLADLQLHRILFLQVLIIFMGFHVGRKRCWLQTKSWKCANAEKV